MKKLSKSNEDYLECLYLLENEGGKIRSFVIAERLGVSKPAVTKAMHNLQEMGLVEKSNYSEIILTKKGREKATLILDKHNLIKAFLIAIGVDEATAAIDCCKIEHILSKETLLAFKNFIDSNKQKTATDIY